MDRRTVIAVLLMLVVLVADKLLTSHWSKDQQPSSPPGTTATVADSSAAAGGGITAPGGASPSPGSASAVGGAAAGRQGVAPIAGGPRVAPAPILEREIRNGHFSATFTSLGGSVSSWVLPEYKDPLRRNAPVDLIVPGRRALQVFVSTPYFNYDFSNVPFRLEDNLARDSSLTFIAEDSTGVVVTKTFRKSSIPRSLDVEIRIYVPSDLGPIQYRWGWASPLPATELNPPPREFQAVALLGAKLDAVDAAKFAKMAQPTQEGNVRWAGDRNKYFIATLIPDSATVDAVKFEAAPPVPGATAGGAASGSQAGGMFGPKGDPTAGVPVVWMAGAAPPGTTIIRHAKLYAGPIHYDTLVALGAGLDQVANLGWAWIVPLSALLLRLLNLLYKAIPNYGIAIIILSAATKLVFAPLTQTSLRSAKAMHRLQPEVNAIRERYKDDAVKMNSAMMNLYKENKVNPLGGCLPMLLQIPVFAALYNILLNSIELRAAGFLGYIQDLSGPDVLMTVSGFPIHMLPVLMTGSTFIMQSQTPIDPRQKSMMAVMPLMMLIFMYSFPSGVILYWTVNNLLSALQQYMVNVAEDRKMAAGG